MSPTRFERPVLRDPGFYAVTAVGLFALFGIPQILDDFAVYQMTQYVVLSVYALSLAYIWGYGGILSFGQSAFFGLGGYTFAVSAINMGDTTIPLMLAFAVPALFGAALGYFMFYGKLSDVYLGVVTLVVALIFWKIINTTAGPEYAIGDARLGGFNGIPSIPIVHVPGDPSAFLDFVPLYQFFTVLLILIYIGLRVLIASDFGRITVSIRENETRTALLGYDVRRHKVIVFAIGSGIAGLAGAMWATYQTFIDPTSFSLEMSAKALIWTMAGGIGTLFGPILGVIGLQYLSLRLGELNLSIPGLGIQINNFIVLGAILIALVLVLPKGILPSIRMWLTQGWTLIRQRRGASSGQPATKPATGDV